MDYDDFCKLNESLAEPVLFYGEVLWGSCEQNRENRSTSIIFNVERTPENILVKVIPDPCQKITQCFFYESKSYLYLLS